MAPLFVETSKEKFPWAVIEHDGKPELKHVDAEPGDREEPPAPPTAPPAQPPTPPPTRFTFGGNNNPDDDGDNNDEPSKPKRDWSLMKPIAAIAALIALCAWLGFSGDGAKLWQWMGSHMPYQAKRENQPPPKNGNFDNSGLPAITITSVHKGSMYCISWGDTLSGLAERNYGKASLWPKFRLFNPGLPADPRDLQAGGTMYIPSLQELRNRIASTAAVASKATIAKTTTRVVTMPFAMPEVQPPTNTTLVAMLPTGTATFTREFTPRFAAPLTAAAAIASPTLKTRRNEKSRKLPAGYEIPLPAGTQTPPVGTLLETHLLLYNAKGPYEQHQIADSKVVRTPNGKIAIDVPLRRLPADTFGLLIDGINNNEPLMGKDFVAMSEPLRKFPGRHDGVKGFLFETAKISGTIGLLALRSGGNPIFMGIGAGDKGVQMYADHRLAREQKKLKAAENATLDAQIKAIQHDATQAKATAPY